MKIKVQAIVQFNQSKNLDTYKKWLTRKNRFDTIRRLLKTKLIASGFFNNKYFMYFPVNKNRLQELRNKINKSRIPGIQISFLWYRG